MTLFDDGNFGFCYDVLSSYYPYGNYELKDNKLIATTNDGIYQYVFKYDGGQFIFIQSESSNISLVDEKIGIHIIDGSRVALR